MGKRNSTKRRASAKGEARAPAMKSFSPKRVLVVEDHEDSREVMVEMLETGGYEVREAATAALARALLAREHFDVVAIDAHLGDGEGTDVIRDARARGRFAGSRAILVTADPEPSLEGADVVRKPVRMRSFLDLVARRMAALRSARPSSVPAPERLSRPSRVSMPERLSEY